MSHRDLDHLNLAGLISASCLNENASHCLPQAVAFREHPAMIHFGKTVPEQSFRVMACLIRHGYSHRLTQQRESKVGVMQSRKIEMIRLGAPRCGFTVVAAPSLFET